MQAAIDLGAPLQAKDFLEGQLYTWLAWHETPGRPFGTAMTSRVLDPASPRADAFVAWFKALFE